MNKINNFNKCIEFNKFINFIDFVTSAYIRRGSLKVM